jgi:dTDP-D-glucose 4,6-dehydratase
MNNLFATWHGPEEVDLAAGLAGTVELLSEARNRMGEVPELRAALRLLDVAIDEVWAMCGEGAAPKETVTI